MISVLIVDDSAFMRKALSLMLESDPQIKVVGTARNGHEGIEKIRQLNPDVVTLDIEMPGMDGLTALGIIMKELPRPVIMVSSLTTEGAQATVEALQLGAVDFIPKNLSSVSLDITSIKEELVAKVKGVARRKALPLHLRGTQHSTTRTAADRPADLPPRSQPAPQLPHRNFGAVVLGISTGGPFALLQIIPKLVPRFPLGILIVQHMPPRFTKSLSERLDSLSHITVKEAEQGDEVLPGTALIAPGGKHLTLARNGSGHPRVQISSEPNNTLYKPCVDVMVTSAVQAYSMPLLGVIMTGMGTDGLEGLRLVKQKKGFVIAQNEETCVVYGMPRAVVEAGLADVVLPLEQIPLVLNQLEDIRYQKERSVL
jgi:two-component system chemotaxis response regulator CheB